VFFVSGPGGVAGYIAPLAITLAPGAKYKLLAPFAKFWSAGRMDGNALTSLIADGFALRAWIEVSPEMTIKKFPVMPTDLWTGRIVSGELRSLRRQHTQ
jgi:hypothetical protein